jgi:putative endonuclease
MMTNKINSVLYVGITNNLIQRVYQHKNKLVVGFTAKYNIVKLVYFEIFNDPADAIFREKQLKAGSRKRKIESMNPAWNDLYDELIR